VRSKRLRTAEAKTGSVNCLNVKYTQILDHNVRKKSMKVLVTGATGFIGAVLTKELIKNGHLVRALVLVGESTESLLKEGVEIRFGNLTKKETLRHICDDMDIVFHLAGLVADYGKRKLFYDAIYEATKNLLDEAVNSKVGRFVYISSIAALGLGRHLKGIKESDPAFKSGIPYNDAKLDTEELVLRKHKEGSIACTIIRPANVIGPRSAWVRSFIDRTVHVKTIPLIDHGKYGAGLIYVDNLVDGIIMAGTSDIAKGKIYHLRDDWNVTWKQYMSDMGAFIGKETKGNIPYKILRVLGYLLEIVWPIFGKEPPSTRLTADITGRDNDVDNSLIKQELGWKTRVTYPEAMAQIGEWVAKTYNRDVISYQHKI
jgi:nucleoside-diphosphate-sugar epimerase